MKPIRVLFICHGNICRSVMAEFIMKKYIEDYKLNDKFIVDSKATSTEEIGNDIYGPAKMILKQKGIPYERHYASQIAWSDYDKYDYIIGMDSNNMRNISRLIPNDPEGKISKLNEKDVYDPWYSNDFETAFIEINDGVKRLFDKIVRENNFK